MYLEIRAPQHARKEVVRVSSPAARSAQDTMENWEELFNLCATPSRMISLYVNLLSV